MWSTPPRCRAPSPPQGGLDGERRVVKRWHGDQASVLVFRQERLPGMPLMALTPSEPLQSLSELGEGRAVAREWLSSAFMTWPEAGIIPLPEPRLCPTPPPAP